jgi:glycosyltransferase involved in cell wall biosynthesis
VEDLLAAGKLEVEPGGKAARSIQRLRLAAQVRTNGIAFDPNSAEELSRALLLLDSHPELRRAMGANSRRIIGGFSCENFARNAVLAVRAATGGTVVQPAKMAVRRLPAESTSACD